MYSAIDIEYPLSAKLIRHEIESSYAFKTYGIDQCVEVMINTPRCVLDAIEHHLQGEL
jgi:hypothetical protein